MDNLDLFAKKNALNIAKILTMPEEEFNAEHEKRKKFRKLLVSLMKNESTHP